MSLLALAFEEHFFYFFVFGHLCYFLSIYDYLIIK